MRTLRVDLGERSYPIYIGHDLLADPDLLVNHIHSSQVVLISNVTVAPLYLQKVRQALGASKQITEILLPDGEQFKTLATLGDIFDEVMAAGHNRTTTFVALGGGVVGDITGFAAAAYQRGVRFVQLPTTLLAQVDSSVGGKTGVNHALGKNMIGAFHQPQCVIADTATLDTLPDEHLSAGLAEVIKYGAIDSIEFFEWIESNMQTLLARDPAALAQAIEESCAHKARIVAEDEREQGRRALLNLGHTFGHAIETATGYGEWLHGAAVAAGMCMAARLSQHIGWIEEEQVTRIRTILDAAQLPVSPPSEMRPQEFLDLMSVDKKVRDGVLNLILLRDIGNAVVSSDYSAESLEQSIASFYA
ncbi:MAG: 3-dehydroquinate synthase [Pseudomonadota bacterium]